MGSGGMSPPGTGRVGWPSARTPNGPMGCELDGSFLRSGKNCAIMEAIQGKEVRL